MAQYTYRSCIYSIPESFRAEYEKSFELEYGREFQGTSDYDGDYWLMAAAYINYLEQKVESLT